MQAAKAVSNVKVQAGVKMVTPRGHSEISAAKTIMQAYLDLKKKKKL